MQFNNSVSTRAIFLILASIVLTFSLCLQAVESSKEAQWQKLSEEVDTWTDGVGTPMDPLIKETVVVLNLLGYTTHQSCEGHLDWGRPYPWVNFAPPETPQFDNAITALRQQREQEWKTLKELYPDEPDYELWDKPESEKTYTVIRAILDLQQSRNNLVLAYFQGLYALLEKYYQVHSCSFDQTLIFTHDIYEIRSVGGDWQGIRNPEEQEIKLNEYRKEMRHFTEFLKSIYFE